MPKRLRGLAFAVVAVAAACSPGPSSTVPSTQGASGAVGGPPDPSATAGAASLGRSAEPCYDIEQVGGPTIDVEFGPPASNTLFGSLVEAHRLDGTNIGVPDPGEASIQDMRSVLGGVETVATIIPGDEAPAQILDVVATAGLTVDAGDSRSIPVRVEGNRIVLTFPDIDANAWLNLRFDYRDTCYRLTTTATAKLQIGSVATVAACPTAERSSLDAYLDRVNEDLLVLVDETPVPSAIQTGEWPWLAGNFASDSGTVFGMWDRDAAPIRGAHGARLVFRLGGARAGLTEMMTRFYTRSDAVHEFDREIHPVVARTPQIQRDGTVLLRLPDLPGRYVAFTSFAWNTPCLNAGSVANFEVDAE